MTKQAKIDTEVDDMVSLLTEDEMQQEMGTAFSSVMLNPFVKWIKFILTDDKPNGNKQRVPKEEYPNLIKSGIFMPIKMAVNRIAEGHPGALPLGVITHIKEDGDQLVALAALWSNERPKDVEMLQEKFNQGSQINVSWEIKYANSDSETGGVQVLRDTELTAATIVGLPAYKGRTPMIAFAAKKWSKPYIEQLPDSSFLYIEPNKTKDASGKTPNEFRHFPVFDENKQLDEQRLKECLVELGTENFPQPVLASVKEQVRRLTELHQAGASLEEIQKDLGIELQDDINSNSNTEEIKNKMEKDIKELEAELLKAQTEVVDAKKKLEEAEKALADKDKTLTEKDAAIAELTTFKTGVEDEKAKVTKMATIKEKFATAKIEKDDKYFEDNSEYLLGLEDGTLDFMLQELTSFANKDVENGSGEASLKVPNLVNKDGKMDVNALVQGLKERKIKK